MPLTDLPRTTSFRLALLFLLLFGTASLGLFAFLFAQTNGFLVRMTDDWLNREQAEFAGNWIGQHSLRAWRPTLPLIKRKNGSSPCSMPLADASQAHRWRGPRQSWQTCHWTVPSSSC